MGRALAFALMTLVAGCKERASPTPAARIELATTLCRAPNGALLERLYLSAEEAKKRYGYDATRYSQAPTTSARTIQVCGEDGESEWLMRAACDDGSHPIRSYRSADKAKKGVTMGGLCHRQVDRYVVACPERAYEVLLDPRFCMADELPTNKRECLVARDPQRGNTAFECTTGQKVDLERDPDCRALRIASAEGVSLCLASLRVVEIDTLDGRGRVDLHCGSIWSIDHGMAMDGAYNYVDDRLQKVVAECGGLCRGRGMSCPECEHARAGCGNSKDGRKNWETVEGRLYELFAAQGPEARAVLE